MLLLSALLLDRMFGEPKYYHPLVGFGFVASLTEKLLNKSELHSALVKRLLGLMALCLLVLPFIFVAIYLSSLSWLFDLALLTLAIGYQSLREHALAIRNALINNNFSLARKNVSMIVSRDTSNLNEEQICKASIESILENGSDAIFSAIFWFIIAGAPGVVAYRLVNTLDAMWGYKSSRYLHFGWAAARADDVLNYVPARLTAFSYFLASCNTNALKCWLKQAKNWKSPNAGPVMASGAGGLNLQLGGEATYNGELQIRPMLGSGKKARVTDIDSALNLVFHSIIIWMLALIIFYLALHYANV